MLEISQALPMIKLSLDNEEFVYLIGSGAKTYKRQPDILSYRDCIISNTSYLTDKTNKLTNHFVYDPITSEFTLSVSDISYVGMYNLTLRVESTSLD